MMDGIYSIVYSQQGPFLSCYKPIGFSSRDTMHVMTASSVRRCSDLRLLATEKRGTRVNVGLNISI